MRTLVDGIFLIGEQLVPELLPVMSTRFELALHGYL